MTNPDIVYPYPKDNKVNNIASNWNKVLHDGFIHQTGNQKIKPESYSFSEKISNKLVRATSKIELKLYVKSSIDAKCL